MGAGVATECRITKGSWQTTQSRCVETFIWLIHSWMDRQDSTVTGRKKDWVNWRLASIDADGTCPFSHKTLPVQTVISVESRCSATLRADTYWPSRKDELLKLCIKERILSLTIFTRWCEKGWVCMIRDKGLMNRALIEQKIVCQTVWKQGLDSPIFNASRPNFNVRQPCGIVRPPKPLRRPIKVITLSCQGLDGCHISLPLSWQPSSSCVPSCSHLTRTKVSKH